MSCPRTSSGSYQIAGNSSRCLTQSTDNGDYRLPCAGIECQHKLAIYKKLSVQAGYLQLHMQLPSRGSPSDSLAILDAAVDR